MNLKLRSRILFAISMRGAPVGNTEIRAAIGAPAMPACTVTWNLNELADMGYVSCNRMGRFNRWTLTDMGRRLMAELLGPVDARIGAIVAGHRSPPAASEVVRQASAQARRSVFDVRPSGARHAG